MEIIDVEKSESFYYLDQIRRLYTASFPSAQIRPIEIITKMLELDPNYHLFGVRIHNSIVGFSLLYTFNDLKFAFLDYLAIDRKYRGCGIGSELFRYILNSCCTLMENHIGLIFEVQRGGSNSSEPDKNGIRQRRILFYTRFGAKIFEGLHYLLPNAHGGEPEDMYLMMVPNLDIPYITKNSVIRIIKRGLSGNLPLL